MTTPSANPLLADPALGTVTMIAQARSQGLTWTQIAPAIGCPDGKAAKAKAKRLARAAQAEALRTMIIKDDPDDGPPS